MALTIRTVGLDPHFVDYTYAWDLQKDLHAQVLAGQSPSTVLLLEHDAVYTAGRRTEENERPTLSSTPVIDVDRGGKLTWHGPGQLVGYPILRLPDRSQVREYVWNIEQILIDVLDRHGVKGERIEGWEGVWVPADERGPARKVAAIGMRVKSGVSMHGFAINVSNDLSPFSAIIPCGITTAGVTSIEAETSQSLSPAKVAEDIAEIFQQRAALFDAASVSTSEVPAEQCSELSASKGA